MDKVDEYRMVNGNKVRERPTTGWDIEVEMKDGTILWLLLKEVKETNSMELARYGKDNHLVDELAFVWWAPHVLRKQDQLLENAV